MSETITTRSCGSYVARSAATVSVPWPASPIREQIASACRSTDPPLTSVWRKVPFAKPTRSTSQPQAPVRQVKLLLADQSEQANGDSEHPVLGFDVGTDRVVLLTDEPAG
ncbi:hypothetical protein AB0D49_38195 [Streptomyces sp. NPDC048290]|uniref:hypothetical protein n=1 Tax=Streptomyces sp. NPDC048290 TaxID=3155811 RepID=UPI003425C23E